MKLQAALEVPGIYPNLHIYRQSWGVGYYIDIRIHNVKESMIGSAVLSEADLAADDWAVTLLEVYSCGTLKTILDKSSHETTFEIARMADIHRHQGTRTFIVTNIAKDSETGEHNHGKLYHAVDGINTNGPAMLTVDDLTADDWFRVPPHWIEAYQAIGRKSVTSETVNESMKK